jgi:hypothetical protein
MKTMTRMLVLLAALVSVALPTAPEAFAASGETHQVMGRRGFKKKVKRKLHRHRHRRLRARR